MIRGAYVACTECQHQYRIRYNVGNKFPQSASFHCIDCGELLVVGYDAKREFYLKNIVEVEPDDTATVRNLHPELVIDPALLSDPTYFPSIEFMVESLKKDGGLSTGLKKFRANQFSAEYHQNQWDKIVTDYRYLKEGRWNLLEKKFGRDQNKVRKKILKDVIKTGKFFLIGKWSDQYRDVFSELQKAKKHPEYNNLKSYLLAYSNDFLLDKMFTVMQEYRKVESTFLPTLLSLKQGIKPSGLSSSVNWDEIEMTYGNFYEILGDLLVIPTVINNLLMRNNFSVFATPGFNLNQYVATDKSGRCNNFLNNPKLSILNEFYDSNLRNGTHHKTAKIDKESQTIIIKTGRGGNTSRNFSFVEYSEYCNEVYAHCLILLNLYYYIIY